MPELTGPVATRPCVRRGRLGGTARADHGTDERAEQRRLWARPGRAWSVASVNDPMPQAGSSQNHAACPRKTTAGRPAMTRQPVSRPRIRLIHGSLHTRRDDPSARNQRTERYGYSLGPRRARAGACTSGSIAAAMPELTGPVAPRPWGRRPARRHGPSRPRHRRARRAAAPLGVAGPHLVGGLGERPDAAGRLVAAPRRLPRKDHRRQTRNDPREPLYREDGEAAAGLRAA